MSWQNALFSLITRKVFKPLALHGADYATVRRRVGMMGLLPPRLPSGWRLRLVDDAWSARARQVPAARDGATQSEWIEPLAVGGQGVAASAPTILYLHGGGYFFCSPRSHRPISFALAQGSGARVYVPDYRLAPEHPFPAALDDALTAYRQLLADGVAPGALVVGGDSAGAGLTLALLQALRAAGEPLPAGAMLFSPWSDLAATGASLATNAASDVMFTREALIRSAQYYLAQTPATEPLVSPLYADFSGFPPLLVHASDAEMLLDDAVRVVDKARAAGVQVQFRTWPGVPHAWHLFAPFVPEARAALLEASAFVRAVTTPANDPGETSEIAATFAISQASAAPATAASSSFTTSDTSA